MASGGQDGSMGGGFNVQLEQRSRKREYALGRVAARYAAASTRQPCGKRHGHDAEAD